MFDVAGPLLTQLNSLSRYECGGAKPAPAPTQLDEAIRKTRTYIYDVLAKNRTNRADEEELALLWCRASVETRSVSVEVSHGCFELSQAWVLSISDQKYLRVLHHMKYLIELAQQRSRFVA